MLIVNRKKKSIYHSRFTIHLKVKSGFTLIELLTVISILGILAGIGSFTYNSVQEKSRDTRRKQDLEALRSGLELARQDSSGFYPNTLSSLAPTYIKVLPQDPKTGTSYIYTPQPASCTTACTSYFLQTTLENSNDPGRAPSWDNCPGAPAGPDYVVCPAK
ncbi:MAG: prepilin-type N-terminal cleavage/methylation domain-containing protein [Candidatus Curtissbacteria bacterium]